MRKKAKINQRKMLEELATLKKDFVVPVSFKRDLMLKLSKQHGFNFEYRDHREKISFFKWLSPWKLAGVTVGCVAVFGIWLGVENQLRQPQSVEVVKSALLKEAVISEKSLRATDISSQQILKKIATPAPADLKIDPDFKVNVDKDYQIKKLSLDKENKKENIGTLESETQWKKSGFTNSDFSTPLWQGGSIASHGGGEILSGKAEFSKNKFEEDRGLGKMLAPNTSQVRGNRFRASQGEIALVVFNLEESSQVKINVYDRTGVLKAVLLDEWKTSGQHQIDFSGHDQQGRELQSGIYVINITAPLIKANHKVMLIR
jgi:hypothetical protein